MRPCRFCADANGTPTGWMRESVGDHLGGGMICQVCMGRLLEPETPAEKDRLLAILHAEARRITRARRQSEPVEVTP